MWSALIVMRNPLFQDSSHMPLVQRNQEIETFSPHRADEPFTESIGLRRPKRSFQDPHAHRLQSGIEFR